MKILFLISTVFTYALLCVENEKILCHIPGLENECASIDHIYKELDILTRNGHRVVYIINKEGVFEHPTHQLNMYKFCYDVNVELTPEQKAMLARYHAHKAHDAVGRIIQEIPHESPLYNTCAEQTGMVIETIACGLTPHPECRDILTKIAEYYAHLETTKKRSEKQPPYPPTIRSNQSKPPFYQPKQF